MSKLAGNISFLRKEKKISQERLADELGITRPRLGAYEEGRNEPPIELLIRLSDYFHISIDALLKGDLRKSDPEALMKIGKNRILFPVKVDKDGNDVIEVVPVKASAGYLSGYSDPEFIGELPNMHLPFKTTGKHRAFTIKGDSMPPLKEGTIVIGKYVEALEDIKDGHTYIVLTKNEGLVYKRLFREKKKAKPVFEFHSDNKAYHPYTIVSEEILEVWSFVCSLNIGEFKVPEINVDSMIEFLQKIGK